MVPLTCGITLIRWLGSTEPWLVTDTFRASDFTLIVLTVRSNDLLSSVATSGLLLITTAPAPTPATSTRTGRLALSSMFLIDFADMRLPGSVYQTV